jgi:putative peptidoglycan lipid II flippase
MSPVDRRLRVASLIWGGSILASRLIGLVREATAGRILGGGDAADVFWTAFVIPDFLNYLLAGGALSLVFIPLYSAHLTRGDEEGGERAFAAIANTLVLVLLAALSGLWLATPALAPWVAPGFDAQAQAELVKLTRIVLPAQAFHVIGGLLGAVLQARDRHALPALAPLLYTGSMVVGGLVGQSAEGFAWGVVVGSFLGPFLLPLIGVLQVGFRWRLGIDLRAPDLRTYFIRSLPIMLGFSVVAVDDWILRREGSLLAEGAISTLQYAKTLMKVPMGVFGLATGVAAFPTLSRLVAAGQPEAAWTALTGALRAMLVLAFGAQVVLTVCGQDIAALLYGGRMGPEQIHDIGMVLAIFGIGLWAWAAQTVVSRGFYALGQTWLPTALGSAVVLFALPVYSSLADSLGLLGLPLATSIAITSYVVALITLLKARMGGADAGLGRFFPRAALATALAIAAGGGARVGLLALTEGLPASLGAVLRLGGAGLVGGLAFLALGKLLRVAEVDAVIGLVLRKLRARLPGRAGAPRP